VNIRQEGRHRYCEARLGKLNEVSDWLEQYRKFWTQKLDALESYLDELKTQEKPRRKKILQKKRIKK
jgi:hypothetical protein